MGIIVTVPVMDLFPEKDWVEMGRDMRTDSSVFFFFDNNQLCRDNQQSQITERSLIIPIK